MNGHNFISVVHPSYTIHRAPKNMFEIMYNLKKYPKTPKLLTLHMLTPLQIIKVDYKAYLIFAYVAIITLIHTLMLDYNDSDNIPRRIPAILLFITTFFYLDDSRYLFKLRPDCNIKVVSHAQHYCRNIFLRDDEQSARQNRERHQPTLCIEGFCSPSVYRKLEYVRSNTNLLEQFRLFISRHELRG